VTFLLRQLCYALKLLGRAADLLATGEHLNPAWRAQQRQWQRDFHQFMTNEEPPS
jgi:signal-transduction protein with cAMP-binding, CBS, and nucleotidyltransferase domain